LLKEYWQFLKYNLPPNGGGLRDQPPGWFENGEMLHIVYRAFVEYHARERGHDAAWMKAHPDAARIVDWIGDRAWILPD